MDIFEIIAERKIKEALEKGAFDNLPGKGKPLEIEDLSAIAPEERMAYKVLKNAGILPPEVEQKKVIYELKKEISESNSEDEKNKLRIKLNKELNAYNVTKEKNKGKY